MAIKYWIIILCLLFAVAGCSGGATDGEEHVDLSDPLNGESIVTAADLIAFIQNGKSNTATLAASINVADEFLDITPERGPLTIIGNGNTITGNGDCVIRLGDGCELTLEDVTIVGGSGAIGCLGSATLGGQANVNAVSHAIDCKESLTFASDSRFYIKSNMGSAIHAQALILEEDARVLTTGGASAVDVFQDDVTLMENTTLEAVTQTNYNAMKCAGSLVMRDGSKLIVSNSGDYHGAEVNELEIEGLVTIEATGGSKGVGLFLFDLEQTYYLLGFCEPAARNEVGNGALNFVSDASQIPTPEPTPDEEAETGAEDAEETPAP